MKKTLISNLVISGVTLLVLFITTKFFRYSFSTHYYFTIIFFFSLYFIQTLLLFKLSKTDMRFVAVYNFFTMFKMLMSVFFLVGYYLVFGEDVSSKEKIYFTIYFIALYFAYLIINIKNLFQKTEWKVLKKTIHSNIILREHRLRFRFLQGCFLAIK